jgi:hypothetical protein
MEVIVAVKYNKPTTQIIEEIANRLTKNGDVPFSRKDIIENFKAMYPDANEDTINPMIQGITLNLEGGAPGAIDKNILLSIGTGQFVLLTKANLKKYFTITAKN